MYNAPSIQSRQIVKKGDKTKRGNAKIEYRDSYYSEQVYRNRPQNEWNDCAVRAFAIAFDMPWTEAAEILKKHTGRKAQQGTRGGALVSFLRNEKAMTDLGYKVTDMKTEAKSGWHSWSLTSNEYPNITEWWKANRRETGTMPLLRYALRNPKGRHFMLVKGHACSMVDQVVFDNNDRSTGRHKLYTAFKVEKI